MKKITLFLVVITCISCNSDDDTTPTDPIVGTWDLAAVLVNNVEQTVSDCERLSVIDVFENGFYSINEYDDATGTCQTFISDDAVQVMPNPNTILLTDYPDAMWESQDNGTYAFTLEETAPVSIITLEIGNAFSFTETEGDTIRKYIYAKVID